MGENWVYQNISLLEYLPELVSEFHPGVMRSACDGSFDEDSSTVAWYIDGNRSIIRGVNIVPLGSVTLDPKRCELADIYTILRIVDFMVKYYDLDNGVIEIGCDCKGGLIQT